MRHALTSLWAREPWKEDNWFGLSTDMDRVFEGVFAGLNQRERTNHFVPAVDIEETDSHYLVSVDVPGLSKGDINIELKDEVLTVSGERKYEESNKKNNGRFVERAYGKFQRSFTLPNGVDANKVEAIHKNGVLEIAVPKAEVKRPRVVEIQEGKGSFFDKFRSKKENSEEKEVH